MHKHATTKLCSDKENLFDIDCQQSFEESTLNILVALRPFGEFLYIMPKSKEPKELFFARMCRVHTNIFRHDGSVLFCLVCDENVSAKQSSQVAQHLQTAKHMGNFKRKTKGTKTQSLLTTLKKPAEIQVPWN